MSHARPPSRCPRNRRIAARLLATGALIACAAAAEQVQIADELERLMAVHGFAMKAQDLDSTREALGRAEGDDLVPRLRVLLEGFDHIIVQRPEGGVERVLILGEKTPYAPPAPTVAEDSQPPDEEEPAGAAEIVLETQRKGASHAVTLTLEGAGGKRVQRVLLIDTGADYVVLPASLVPLLGIPPSALRSQPVQTANGRIDARMGQLSAILMGGQRVEGVEAAFIDDSRLGGNSLLGMSVLGRFRVTIDDEHNRVVLAGK